MKMGNIMIITYNYAAAEGYFNKVLLVSEAISGYHSIYVPCFMVWVGFISENTNTEKLRGCLSGALHDRTVAYGVDEGEDHRMAKRSVLLGR